MPRAIQLEELRAALAAGGAVEAQKSFRGELIPARFLRQLAEEQPGAEEELFLALWPDTPSRILEGLAGAAAARPELAAALARHPRAPKAVFDQLAQSGERQTRLLLAAGKQLDASVAASLAEDPDPDVRARLAMNGALAAALQQRLARDPLPMVRAALVKNPRLDDAALRLLAEDEDLLVRAAAVVSAKVADDHLLDWADTDDFYRQLFLLQRETLPDPVLESLCFSRHPRIQELAVSRRRLSPDEMLGWSEKGTPRVRAIIAGRAGLPAAVQKLLVSDAEPAVRLALAANPELAPAIALTLAERDEPALWRALARNPHLPAAAVTELCREPSDAELRKWLAARAGLTGEQIELLLEHGGEEMVGHLSLHGVEYAELDAARAETLAAHRLPVCRAFAAVSRNLSPASMKRLGIDPVAAVRRRLADNSGLPEPLLRFLSTDTDPETAERAGERLRQLQSRREEEAAAVAAAATAGETAKTADDGDVIPSPGRVLKRIIRKMIREE